MKHIPPTPLPQNPAGQARTSAPPARTEPQCSQPSTARVAGAAAVPAASRQLSRQLETPPDPQRGKIWDARLAEKELQPDNSVCPGYCRAKTRSLCSPWHVDLEATSPAGQWVTVRRSVCRTGWHRCCPGRTRREERAVCAGVRERPAGTTRNHRGDTGHLPATGASWRPERPKNGPKP